MNRSAHWTSHFSHNLKIKRVDWDIEPKITDTEKQHVLKSLQAWQLGETSDGSHLLAAAKKYAHKTNDMIYPLAVSLFIKEEQKHGNNLGTYLDLIGENRIKKDWGDTMFRKVRYFNTSMELWTLAVITVESTAQIFYQSLKDATECALLKQICTDILIDEASHIEFQTERMQIIYDAKNPVSKYISYHAYKFFYFSTIMVVWFAHKKAFMAGGNDLRKYLKKMSMKFDKTFGKIRAVSNADYKVVLGFQ